MSATLFLFAGISSCGDSPTPITAEQLHVTRIDSDACVREIGTLTALPSTNFTPWYTRSASGPDAPDLLDDLRPAFVCDLPGLFSYALAEREAPQLLTTAVHRLRPEKRSPVRAEIFWRVRGQLTSLAAVEIAMEDEDWLELQVEVPAGAGELVFAHRFAGIAMAEQSGKPVAWSQPTLAPLVKPDLPDVLLITVDTLRADAVGKMPYLQSLMNNGKQWRRAYSPSNWTLPAYASLMTGLSPEEHGCGRGPFAPTATGKIENRNFRRLGSSPTLADAMHDAGYATCMLFQNPLMESWTGLDRGFDRYVRCADRVAANHNSAVQWWQGQQHRARFLAVHFMAPHLPYAPLSNPPPELAPNPLAILQPDKLFDLDHTAAERRAYFDLNDNDRAVVKQWYEAEVIALDLELQSLVEELRASSPNCVILIHADHGEELWDAGSFEHGHSFDDSVIHVPLAIIYQGVIAPEVVNEPVAAFHLSTYLLEILAIPNRLPASALSNHKGADLRVRSAFPLFRSETGGKQLAADGTWQDLPFDPAGSLGNPGVIEGETAARMAELGYSGEDPKSPQQRGLTESPKPQKPQKRKQ